MLESEAVGFEPGRAEFRREDAGRSTQLAMGARAAVMPGNAT
jgi:hypothetical protein